MDTRHLISALMWIYVCCCCIQVWSLAFQTSQGLLVFLSGLFFKMLNLSYPLQCVTYFSEKRCGHQLWSNQNISQHTHTLSLSLSHFLSFVHIFTQGVHPRVFSGPGLCWHGRCHWRWLWSLKRLLQDSRWLQSTSQLRILRVVEAEWKYSRLRVVGSDTRFKWGLDCFGHFQRPADGNVLSTWLLCLPFFCGQKHPVHDGVSLFPHRGKTVWPTAWWT